MSLKNNLLSTNPISNSVGTLVARIIVGIYFMIHSYELFNADAMKDFADFLSKDLHFPYPLLMAYLRTSIEFFGGLMLVLGIYTRIAAILIMLTMLVATFTAGKGDIFGDAELNIIYVGFCITIFLMGSGKHSIQKYFLKE